MNRNEIKATLKRTAKRRGVEIDGLLLRDYVEDISEMLATPTKHTKKTQTTQQTKSSQHLTILSIIQN